MSITLQKQILDRIRTQGVKPTKKGYFKMRNYILWAFLGLFVATLSLGFGMIIFTVQGADFEIFEKLGFSSAEKVFYSIPFFWILAMIAVAAIAYINFRNTRRGYKTNAKHLGIITLLVVLALGSVIYALNITDYLDRQASERIPLYNALIPFNTNTWFDPAHGLLSGSIREKNSDTDFTLRDQNSVLWHVIGENISMPIEFKYQAGDRVKLIGRDIGDDTFKVVEIRPWGEK